VPSTDRDKEERRILALVMHGGVECGRPYPARFLVRGHVRQLRIFALASQPNGAGLEALAPAITRPDCLREPLNTPPSITTAREPRDALARDVPSTDRDKGERRLLALVRRRRHRGLVCQEGFV
jgi:hypothetical protein